MRKVLFWAVVACAVAAAAAAASPHAGVPRRGAPAAPNVHVSGKWAVVVRDRAGRLRRRVHFENALLRTNPLGEILSGFYTPSGQWRLSIDVAGASRIDVPAIVTADGTTTVLTAKTTATATGTIESVLSQVYLCGNSTAPAACTSGTSHDFTGEGGLSIPVQAGDTISAIVRLSFAVPATFAVDATAAEMFMAQVIRGALTVGAWRIELSGPASGLLPDDPSVKWDYHISDLILTAQDVLSADAIISSVQADQYTCAPTVSPLACAAGGAAAHKLALFQHQLSPGSQVVAGQQITVHWTINFS